MPPRPKKLPIPDSFDPLDAIPEKQALYAISKKMLDGVNPVGAVIAIMGEDGRPLYSRMGDRTLGIGLATELIRALQAPVKFDCPEDHDGEAS